MRCENCKFYVVDYSLDAAGNCRRYPPKIIPEFRDICGVKNMPEEYHDNMFTIVDAVSLWPCVGDREFCGEYCRDQGGEK